MERTLIPGRHPLDILFLTDYSEYCFRSIPAIVRMAEALKVRLTVLNVYDPATSSQASADARVNSFFPDADRYAACHRIAVPGPVIDAVRRHCHAWPVNFMVAPASDVIGFPRIGGPSTRSRLIRECGLPLWTIGRSVTPEILARPVRNVACWLDFYSPQTSHLAFAVEYANKLNARLHLLRGLPEIDEGTLGSVADRRAIHPRSATEEMLRLCASSPVRPEVHVSCGTGRAARARMLRECDADVVFLRNEDSVLAAWMGFGLHLNQSLPCPAVYVGDRMETPVWNLETSAAHRAANAVSAGFGARGRSAVM